MFFTANVLDNVGNVKNIYFRIKKWEIWNIFVISSMKICATDNLEAKYCNHNLIKNVSF